MYNELIVIHRKGVSGQTQSRAPLFASSGGPEGDDVQLGWFYFKTCLRQIAVGEEHMLSDIEITADDEILQGDDGYRFLLQVICGLHSPMVGETEVYGQFKNAVAAFTIPASPFGTRLQRYFRSLFEDAKKIRQAHLEDLGSQTYGSVVRRECKGLKQVHLLGAGHLVQEILPWVCKTDIEVHIHSRDPEKARAALGMFKDLKFHSLEERKLLVDAHAIVIAAPVSAEWFTQWVPADATPKIVFDLRDDSSDDRVPGFARVLELGQVFAMISENQAHLESRRIAALNAIDAAVQERGRHVEYRPFGWEDVCA